jgi:hypothetical protein
MSAKLEAKKFVKNIIKETNFKPKWFITVHYKSNKSFILNDKIDKVRIKDETDSLDKVSKEFRHIKNLMLCKVYDVKSASKIRCNKFRFLSFYELGESKFNYHNHIAIESIPNNSSITDIRNLLEWAQLKHPGIENSKSAIDVKEIYSNGWIPYVLKTATESYLPLDLIYSDVK